MGPIKTGILLPACMDYNGTVVGHGERFVPRLEDCVSCLCSTGKLDVCEHMTCDSPEVGGCENGTISGRALKVCCDLLCLNEKSIKLGLDSSSSSIALVSLQTAVLGSDSFDMDSQEMVWDNNFSPPEYLYKIILVCMFFGFILFLIFFALVRYLRFQNKARAILRAQEEREAASQFPPRLDILLEGLGQDSPLVDTICETGNNVDKNKSPCTCNAPAEDSCVCQPLNPQPTDDTTTLPSQSQS